MNTKVYRLSKDTNEITEISESQALKIIGYYHDIRGFNPLHWLIIINTPDYVFSTDKQQLDNAMVLLSHSK